MIRRDRCLLCGLELEPLARGQVQRHPDVDYCLVRYTDAWGVSLTDDQAAAVDALCDEAEAEAEGPQVGVFDLHPPVEYVLTDLFAAHGLPRLGGASSGKGWTSYAIAQRCFYLFRRRYVDQDQAPPLAENSYQAIGSVLHVLLALYYANMTGAYVAITPEVCYRHLLAHANPAYVNEGRRIFDAYRLYYAHDDLVPLAVEYDLRDPRTGSSTRYDLIAHRPKPKPGYRAGTYIVEHKSSARFDFDTLDSWANDGEVIGEAAHWRRLGLDKRFGPLQGVIVNIVGKQKDPKFHRTTISPDSLLIDSHLNDLRGWDALIGLCRAASFWPRSRANCVNRWGRCERWEECATCGG
jgi:hypothetical protein